VDFTARGTVHYQNNEGTSWDEGRIYNPDGSGRNGVIVKSPGRDGFVIYSPPPRRMARQS
jgi:hypothetical protein